MADVLGVKHEMCGRILISIYGIRLTACTLGNERDHFI